MARESQQHGTNSDEHERVLKVAVEAKPYVEAPPDLGMEVLTVETTDGYQPGFPEIVEFCLKGLAEQPALSPNAARTVGQSGTLGHLPPAAKPSQNTSEWAFRPMTAWSPSVRLD